MTLGRMDISTAFTRTVLVGPQGSIISVGQWGVYTACVVLAYTLLLIP